MGKLEFTDEQKKDIVHSLFGKMKELFLQVFRSDKPKQGKDLNEYLLTQTQSEEERETLEEILDEINTYHQKRKELDESGKDCEDWYDAEVERIVREVKPDASQEEIDQVKEAIAKLVDDEISQTTLTLEELDTMVRVEMGKEEEV